MLPLTLNPPQGRPARILCLGAHADDIEIGCGGTVLQLLAEHPGSSCHWVVFSGAAERACEARNSAERFLGTAGDRHVDVHEFRDGHFPVALSAIKDVLEEIKRGFTPDLIFTHYREDRHQDHRLVSDVTWQTFRNQFILEYEVPKFDGDLGAPNCFVALAETVWKQKVDHLVAGFPSQREKRWFSEETFLALMRLRGMECAAPGGYAEAFYGRKVVLHSCSVI